MSTWGLNTSPKALKNMMEPPIEVRIGRPIKLYDQQYTVLDIRLHEDKVYLEIEDGLTGKRFVPVAVPQSKKDVPNVVAVIRPTDRRRGSGILNKLQP